MFTRKQRGNTQNGYYSADSDNSNQSGEPARENSVGGLLRATREQLGWDLPGIGSALRIRPEYLAALERNTVEGLPGPAYATGFLRAYADYLGLDGGQIVQRFKAEKRGLHQKPELTFPMPLTERGIPGMGFILIAVIVSALAYGTYWYFVSGGDHAAPPAVTPVPARLLPQPEPTPAPAPAPVTDAPKPVETSSAAQPVTQPTPSVAPSPAASLPAPQQQPVATPTTAPPAPSQTPPPAAATATTPVPAPAPVPAPVASPAGTPTNAAAVAGLPSVPPTAPGSTNEPGPHSFGYASVPGHIAVRAKSECWVQVNEGTKVIFVRVLKAGDLYFPPDRPNISLRAGNSGALDVTLDGKVVSNGGPSGQPRTFLLDAERLTAGTAVEP